MARDWHEPSSSLVSPKPSTLNPEPETLKPEPATRTRNPKISTVNPTPQTLNQATTAGGGSSRDVGGTEVVDEAHNGDVNEAHTVVADEADEGEGGGRLVIALDGTFPSALQMLKHSELVRFTQLSLIRMVFVIDTLAR